MEDKKAQEINYLIHSILFNEQRLFNEQSTNLDLTVQQARTLELIQKDPGMIQREIADALSIRDASVSSMLKNLERDGYVKRRKDRRSDRNKRIFLTDKGDEIIKELGNLFEDVEKQIVKPLENSETKDLLVLLRKIDDELSED
ncbi:MarR family winged helix-turn-helix transcriptional regulator [Companilactobacillus keshanensis]|uniref:MarR family winged helix-turn-helix transcriptional regulator n=1 Tax=Companilactobacillus keshanensis TaxID=2486003 RepID=A0ABW4BSK1_9LACO|nr:MarR family winged helix-turn-helix transcriptional regulator [Companilactobacillus keshanensis]